MIRYNKILLTLACILLLQGCSLLRKIGLYNRPPDFSESFKNYYHIDFIDHNNDPKNLTVILQTKKSEYSPYENIELKLTIKNNDSINSIYVYAPNYFNFHYWSEVVVKDSLNRIQNLRGPGGLTISPNILVNDEYGRRLSPIIAPFNKKIAPNDSLIQRFSFMTGESVCEIVRRALGGYYLERENIPGEYTVYFIQAHEKYDQIKGPINDSLISPIIKYKVRDYSKEETEIRNEFAKIVNSLTYGKYYRIEREKFFQEFSNKYPQSVYVQQLRYYINLLNR